MVKAKAGERLAPLKVATRPASFLWLVQQDIEESVAPADTTFIQWISGHDQNVTLQKR